MDERRAGRTLFALTRKAALVAVLSVLAACSAIIRNHGYVPTDQQLAQVQVGVDTRDSVAQVIGTPTAGGILDPSGYYYVASKFRHYGFFAPEEVDREVLAVRFTPSGTVSNIERFGLSEGRVVALSRRVTDDNIANVSFLRQLFGSLGNFDAGALLGDGGGDI